MSNRSAALVFGGVMIGFKIWSIVLIYLAGSGEGLTTFLLGTHVLWITLPILLLWAPAIFWFRMVRVRRKRQRLVDSEWNIHQEPPVNRSGDS